jgi:hypothetical protein
MSLRQILNSAALVFLITATIFLIFYVTPLWFISISDTYNANHNAIFRSVDALQWFFVLILSLASMIVGLILLFIANFNKIRHSMCLVG